MHRMPSKLSTSGYTCPPPPLPRHHQIQSSRRSGELQRTSSEQERSDTTAITATATGSQYNGLPNGGGANGSLGLMMSRSRAKRKQRQERRRAGGRTDWKKLLWVRQSYPDNYTDASTFLDHLQRNPRLQPYQFWRLVADSTVIVQQVCSVAIFVCCFTGIFQERVNPITIVGLGSAATIAGWIAWDFWVGQEEAEAAAASSSELSPRSQQQQNQSADDSSPIDSKRHLEPFNANGISSSTNTADPQSSTSDSTSPISRPTSADAFHHSPLTLQQRQPPSPLPYHQHQWQGDPLSSLSPRTQQRLATAKSATLIYCIVLGLSPILKSLTRSTTSDSIWALSTWLMGINIFFFDYYSSGGSSSSSSSLISGTGAGAGVTGTAAHFPASLSTNAALMASTVLASRLTSTTHVFSLTLFSIQVFGLFPTFRRHLLRVSRGAHLVLTGALVLGAGSGLAVTVGNGTVGFALLGAVLGVLVAALTMGGASWWLIGLQKWKDEIVGPWDAARPRLRRGWAS